MFKLSRRQLAGGILASSTALAMPSLAFGAMPRVVVIGGGAGGAPGVPGNSGGSGIVLIRYKFQN